LLVGDTALLAFVAAVLAVVDEPLVNVVGLAPITDLFDEVGRSDERLRLAAQRQRDHRLALGREMIPVPDVQLAVQIHIESHCGDLFLVG
jgi:hypothetical protein